MTIDWSKAPEDAVGWFQNQFAGMWVKGRYWWSEKHSEWREHGAEYFEGVMILRPTPEERASEIAAIQQILTGSPQDDSSDCFYMASAIYQAGYRKQVTP